MWIDLSEKVSVIPRVTSSHWVNHWQIFFTKSKIPTKMIYDRTVNIKLVQITADLFVGENSVGPRGTKAHWVVFWKLFIETDT